jgi:uncharacterized protein DUF6265
MIRPRMSTTGRGEKFFFGTPILAVAALALIGAVAVACQKSAVAEPPAEAAKPVKFEKLRWMTGAWRCDDPKEPLEEHWTEARNGVMVGMARIGDDPERATYEIIVIEDRAPEPLMSIRHFGKGLSVKDKRVVNFKLTKSEDKEAVFEDPFNDFPSKIIYRLAGENKLLVRLENKDNSRSMEFPMQRIKP